MSNKILTMTDIVKSYNVGDLESVILKGVNLEVEKGEFLAILGPSGSGKSTLMNIIGCLDVPTSGSYILNGEPIASQTEKELARIRRHEIGFIFQSYYMLSQMKAYENVELPLIYAGVEAKERRERAMDMLNKVGLGDRTDYYPRQLSGGQQQRIAIARAMVTNPTILLADEPTGALDQKTGAQIMELFRKINDEGHCIIMITHDINIAKRAKVIARLTDGELGAPEKNAEGLSTLSYA